MAKCSPVDGAEFITRIGRANVLLAEEIFLLREMNSGRRRRRLPELCLGVFVRARCGRPISMSFLALSFSLWELR